MADNVVQAVRALYHHPDESVKKQANEWLEAWQSSQAAWSISSAILNDPNAELDVRYFCALTLRTKVRQDFEELPSESVSSLRDSLIACLGLYASQAMVCTQLCLAFVAMVAHTPRDYWGQQGVLSWLVESLERLPKEASIKIMIELLIILPEEASSYLPSVRPERRRELTDDLQNSAPMALQILATCLSNADQGNAPRILDAFSRWLYLAHCGGLPEAELARHPLTDAAIEGLGKQETFDDAVEAVVSLINATSDGGQPGKSSLDLISKIVPAVLGLLPRFSRCVQTAKAEQNGHPEVDDSNDDSIDSEDFAKGAARLFVELGEAYTAMIASGSPDAVKPVEALLQVAAHPDNSIAEMSFNFWNRLSRQLGSSFSSKNDPAQNSAKVIEARQAPFLPAFSQLVNLIAGRLKYESFDAFEKMHEEDKEDFRQFRYSVSDTLLDAAHVLGEDKMLQLLVEPLQTVAQKGGSTDWEAVEALLQCTRSVSQVVRTPQHPIAVKLLKSLPQLPKIPKLQCTAALVISSYASWIDSTLSAGGLSDSMPQLLKMLSEDLAGVETGSAAALALRSLCETCGRKMAPFSEALTQLYNQVQEAGSFGSQQQALQIDEDDVQQIMQAVVVIIATLPADQRRSALNTMLTQVVQQLQNSLGLDRRKSMGSSAPDMSKKEEQKAEQSNQTLALFDRLTVILRYIDDPGAVTDVLVQILPLIEAAMQQYTYSSSAVERIIRTLRYGLRTAGKLGASGSLVPSVMTAIPKWFTAAPHCCYLYLTSELVKIFGGSSRQESSLVNLVKEMLQRSCQGLQKLSDFENNPDVADDTFLLASRTLGYAPKLLLADGALVSVVLRSAQAGILLQHREANESVLLVVARMCDSQTLDRVSKEAGSQIANILDPQCATFFRLLLAGASGMLPSSRISHLAEAAVNLLKVTKQKGLQSFGEALACLPEIAATSSDQERLLKAAFNAANLGDSSSSIGLMDAALSELSELVRRNKRAQEATQASLLPAELRQALF